ncbi:carboxypeptidase-like regulatory domain-containing protein [Roseateles amylovorans]|uniref:Carboxypeptidase regulatory-like domain-containing protein n=1 Tax=Roseateles amylovorans TaxID=2978473 RepID=A0ABY6AWC6_9BURK|nr:carboxypeptidase-like regulatory domain-containing protein [Roseateles amylovorans]UXH76069.1 carboxypeptidase regulatory-like domain-containing protein [Roseateles amylovorans]
MNKHQGSMARTIGRARRFLARAGLFAGMALAAWGTTAQAQTPANGTPPSPTASCTVTAMNRAAPLMPDYSFTIYNIPGAAAFIGPGTPPPAAPFRVRAVCSDGTVGETDLAFPEIGSTVVYTGDLYWRPATPLPIALTVRASANKLTAGQSTQLTTTGTLVDGKTADLSGRAKGTLYTSSNPLIAEVTQDGRATVAATFAPGSSARVVLTAQNEGVAGSTLIELGSRGRIAGRVMRADGSAGVAGAQVTILRSQPREPVAMVTTDASGNYALEDVTAGAFELSVIDPATGDLGRGATALRNEGETATADLRLNGQGTVTIRVLDGSGQPVPNASVSFTSLSGFNDLRSLQTDSSGQVVITRAPVGRFTVSTRVPSSGLIATSLGELALNATPTVTLQLQPIGSIAGQVLASAGGAQAEVQVRLVSATQGIVTQVLTGEDGRFQFDALPLSNGPFTLDAMQGGRLRARVPGLILNSAGQVLQQNIVFSAAGQVSGVVTRDGGLPAADTQVTVQSQVGQRFSFSTRTDAAGRYAIDGIPVGAFSITASAGNGEVGNSAGNIAVDGEIVTLNLQIAANGLVGTVFDRDGRTPVGAGVTVTLQPGGKQTQTNASGQFGFSVSQPGTYQIEARDGAGNRGRTSLVLTAITPGEPKTVDVVFLGRGTVAGVVRDPSGVAQAGAQVRFTSAGAFYNEQQAVTDAQGRYRLDGMFVGEFTVYAINEATQLAGFARGRLQEDGQSLAADVVLQATGTVKGRVLASDGTTAVSGASVELQVGGSTALTVQADAQGGYSFAAVPLGDFSLVASQVATGDRGRAASRVTALNEQRVVNVRLLGLGTVRVKAVDNANRPVAAATVRVDSNSIFGGTAVGITDADGKASIAGVFNGDFSVSLEKGAGDERSVGTGAGTLVNGAAAEVVVTMSHREVGRVTGTVQKSLQASPVAGAEVRLRDQRNGSVRSTRSDAQGRFSFEQVEVGVDYRLNALIEGRTRAQTDVRLAVDGETVDKPLPLLGAGTVSGSVVNAASAPVGGVRVVLSQSDPVYGGTWEVSSQADGSFSLADVPAGNFTLRASTADGRQQAQDSGLVRFDGDVVTRTLRLVDSAIALPITRYDANGAPFDLQGDGSIASGHNGVFAGNGNADVRASRLDLVVNGTAVPFTNGDGTLGRLTQDGQLVEMDDSHTASGLFVTRRVYVPKTGYFARYLEVLENRGTSPITVAVRITDHYAAGTGGSRVVDSTNNDTALTVQGASRDRWLVVDDDRDTDPFQSSGTNPAVTTVFDGPGAARTATDARVSALGPVTRVMLEWGEVTVPAGSSVALMHFRSQQIGRVAARATAERLEQLPPEALEGLTPEERLAVVNFKLPADGLSSLPALPPMEGSRLEGTVWSGDGVTPVAGAEVRFKSSHPLFGRTYRVTTNDVGQYHFDTQALGEDRVVALVRDRYDLTVVHPTTRASAGTDGRFVADTALHQQDLTLSGTGNLRGSVKRHTGALVTDGWARISYRFPGEANPSTLSVPIGNDGSYLFTGLVPGDYRVEVAQDHPQGSSLRGYAPNAMATPEGTTTVVDVVMEDTGEVIGTVIAANNEPVVGASVLLNTAAQTYRQTTTDTGGHFRLSDVRTGGFQLLARGPGNLVAFQDVQVQKDTASSATLKLAGTAQLRVLVRFARGVPAAGTHVVLNSSIGATTDGAGIATFEVPSATELSLQAYHPDNSSLRVAGTANVAQNGTVGELTLDLPPAASIAGQVLRPDGVTAAANIQVILRSADGTKLTDQRTDAQGGFRFSGLLLQTHTVSAEDPANAKFADADVPLATDGEEPSIQLVLADNRISLPARLWDANDFQYDIQTGGDIGGGWRTQVEWWTGNYPVYNNGAATLRINGETFTGDSSALLEIGRRQFAIAQPTPIAGLQVTRKVFVPRGGYFARYLDVLENPGTSPVTVSVALDTRYVNYYGQQSVIRGSTGGTTLQAGAQGDLWAVLDDSNDADPFNTESAPATATVLSNAQAGLSTDAFSFDANANSLQTQWSRVTVPAGGRVSLLHFQVQQVNRAGAIAAAERLTQLPPEALQSLTDEERASVLNFRMPQPQEAVPALPSLTGAVSGRLLEGDNRTVVASNYMQVRSSHPLFNRAYTIGSCYANSMPTLLTAADGTFSLSGVLLDRYSISLPVGTEVEVQANTVKCQYYTPSGHVLTRLPSLASKVMLTGGFTPDTVDVTFPSGILTGTVTGPADFGVTSGRIYTTINGYQASVSIASDGTYVFPGLPEGTTRLSINVPHPQGSALTGSAVDAVVTLGQVTVTDLPLEATGGLTGAVATANGEATVSGQVVVQSQDGRYLTRSTQTDSLGRFQLSALPVGTWLLSVTDPRTQAQTRRTVTIAQGQTGNETITLLGTGTMTLTVKYARGTVAADVPVYLTSAAISNEVLVGRTDGQGLLNFLVPEGNYTVRVRHPTDSYYSNGWVTASGTITANNEQRTLQLNLPARASLDVQVVNADASNAPVSNAIIYMSDAQCTDCYKGRTDGQGRLSITSVWEGSYTVRAQTDSGLSTAVRGTVDASTDGRTLSQTLSLSSRLDYFGAYSFISERQVLSVQAKAGDLISVGINGAQVQGQPSAYLTRAAVFSPEKRELARGYGYDSRNSFLQYNEVNNLTAITATTDGTYGIVISPYYTNASYLGGYRLQVKVNGASAEVVPYAAGGAVTGTVFRADGTTPLAGQTIEVETSDALSLRARVKADATGQFNLSGVPVSWTQVKAVDTLSGQVLVSNSVEVTAGNTSVANLTMPIIGTFQVQATIEGSALRVPSQVQVQLSDDSGQRNVGYLNFTNGKTVSDVLTVTGYGGQVTVSAAHPDNALVAATKVLAVTDGSTYPVQLSLAMASISGRVLTAAGDAAPQSYVELRFANGRYLTGAQTDSTGRYVFSVVPAGQALQLTVYEPQSGLRTVATVTPTAGQALVQDLRLQAIGSVYGVVRRTNGDPLPNVQVMASFDDALEGSINRYGYTDDQGAYRIDAVAAERPIQMRADYYTQIGTFTGTGTVTIPSHGAEVPLDLVIDVPSARVRVQLQMADNSVPNDPTCYRVSLTMGSGGGGGEGPPSLRRMSEGEEGGRYDRYYVQCVGNWVEFDSVVPGPISVDGSLHYDGYFGPLTGTAVNNQTTDFTVVMSVVRASLRQADGTPVTQVSGQVQLQDRTVNGELDDQGNLVFYGLPAGDHVVRLQDTYSSGLWVDVPFTLSSDQAALTLQGVLPATGRVSGVVRSQAGEPMAEVQVYARSSGLPLDQRVFTDAQGRYEFTHVVLGDLTVTAVHPGGLNLASGTGTLSSQGQALELNLQFPAAGAVEGRLLDTAGTPIASTEVRLRLTAGGALFTDGLRSTWTDEQGRFAFSDVAPGGFHLTAYDRNDYDNLGLARGRVKADETVTLDVVMGTAVRLGHSLDDPANGYRVTVYGDGAIYPFAMPEGGGEPFAGSGLQLAVKGLPFPASDGALVLQDRRELEIGPFTMGQLEVSRRVFVPAAGGFARVLETLTNLGPSEIVVPVELSVQPVGGTATRLLVDPSTNGRRLAQFAPLEGEYGGAVALVMAGATGTAPAQVSFSEGLATSRYNLTIPAGQTVRLLNYAVVSSPQDAAAARQQGEGLRDGTVPAQFLGIGSTERPQIRNFNLQ